VRIVGANEAATERDLHLGRLTCPGCDGVLRPWGRARERVIRLGPGTNRAVRPRRARCSTCGLTHVLLPDWLLHRRGYSAPVIWSALAAHAGGTGYRRIALRLRVPATTVRDWLRAFRRAQPALLAELARMAQPALLAEPARMAQPALLAEPAAEGTDVVRVLTRLSPFRAVWRFAVLVTAGYLLCPAAAGRNTSSPHATTGPRSDRPP
jgi:transposase-like protein